MLNNSFYNPISKNLIERPICLILSWNLQLTLSLITHTISSVYLELVAHKFFYSIQANNVLNFISMAICLNFVTLRHKDIFTTQILWKWKCHRNSSMIISSSLYVRQINSQSGRKKYYYICVAPLQYPNNFYWCDEYHRKYVIRNKNIHLANVESTQVLVQLNHASIYYYSSMVQSLCFQLDHTYATNQYIVPNNDLSHSTATMQRSMNHQLFWMNKFVVSGIFVHCLVCSCY